jgi:hypothetical protein
MIVSQSTFGWIRSQGKSVLETAQFGNPTRQRGEHGISWLTRRLTVKLMFPNLKICVALDSFWG